MVYDSAGTIDNVDKYINRQHSLIIEHTMIDSCIYVSIRVSFSLFVNPVTLGLIHSQTQNISDSASKIVIAQYFRVSSLLERHLRRT